MTDLQDLAVTTGAPGLPGGDVSSSESLGLEAKPLSPSRLAWRRFRRHKLAMLSSVILILITVLCVFAPLFTKYGPNQLIRVNGVKFALQHPQHGHWFGTNERANDMWSNVLYGGRVSLAVGITVALASTAFGTVVGVLAGYYGGWLDDVLMRITDLFLAIPFLIALILLTDLPASQPWAQTIIGPSHSVRSIIFIIAILFWMPVARILRGLVLSLKEKEFVEAARAAGASNARIMLRHLVPNCTGQIIINTTLAVAAAIVTEAALSFLGKGVDIFTPTWGNLLGNNQGFLESNPALVLAPGFAIVITVVCVNFIGDGLRDAFDPKQLSV
ncbi:MAG TPA: ABC transporter permease [Acidimicrobiia bacterium]|nr:ABC transporter permease [Acidimicrobiia bacterium]